MLKCKCSVDIFAAEILFTKIGSLSKENTVVSPPLEFPYLVICSYLRCHHPTSVRVLLTRRPSAESGPTLFTFDFIMHGQHRQCQCQWYIVPATTNDLILCLPANITLKDFDHFGFSKTLPKHHIVTGKSTMFQRPRTRVDHGTASQQLLASIFPSTEFFMRGGGKPGVFSGADAALTFVFMAGSFVFKLFNIIVSKFAKLSDVSV